MVDVNDDDNRKYMYFIYTYYVCVSVCVHERRLNSI